MNPTRTLTLTVILAMAALASAIPAAPAAGQSSGPPGLVTPPNDSFAADAELILKTYDALPADMRNLDRNQISTVHRQVDTILQRGEAFLARAQEHPQRGRILFIVARVMGLNFQRYLLAQNSEIKQRSGQQPTSEQIHAVRDAYIDGILKRVQEAHVLVADDEIQRELLKVQGYALFIGGRGDEAAVVWKRILEAYPDDADLDETHTSLITSLLRGAEKASRELREADYEVVVTECDRFLEQHGRSEFLPTVLNVRWKALKEMGAADRAFDHWERYESIIRAGAEGDDPTTRVVRGDYQRILEQVGFNKGFCCYAKGDASRALQIFKGYLEWLVDRQAQNKLSQVGVVYKGRVERVMGTLESIQGKTAPPLDLGEWIAGQKLDVAAEAGNVVALFFSPYEQRRSEPFARALQKFYKDNWHRGFRSAMVVFPKGSKPGQMETVAAWGRGLELTYPIGMDTTKTRECYQRYNVAVGSGTLVVLDRAGNVAWYKMDPTERDIHLAENVYERLLGSP